MHAHIAKVHDASLLSIFYFLINTDLTEYASDVADMYNRPPLDLGSSSIFWKH